MTQEEIKDYVSHMILSSFEELVKRNNLQYGDISPTDDQKVVKIMEELEGIYERFVKYNNFNRGGKGKSA